MHTPHTDTTKLVDKYKNAVNEALASLVCVVLLVLQCLYRWFPLYNSVGWQPYLMQTPGNSFPPKTTRKLMLA